jgi:hypothetical protein
LSEHKIGIDMTGMLLAGSSLECTLLIVALCGMFLASSMPAAHNLRNHTEPELINGHANADNTHSLLMGIALVFAMMLGTLFYEPAQAWFDLRF